LLADYPGAAAAYSLRLLDTDYTGSAIRVRRASDNAEQDIGFDANGDLDTTALATFCSGTDGFVKIWYDQAGSNDAEQTTTGEQPKIYDGTLNQVLTQGSKPAISFNGSNQSFDTTINNPFTYTGEVSVIAAVYKNATAYKPFETLVSAGATGNAGNNTAKTMVFGYGNHSTHNPKPTICTDIYTPSGIQYDGTVGTDERRLLGYYINNWSTHRSTGLSNITIDGTDVSTKTYGITNPSALNTDPLKIGVLDEILSTSYFAGSMHELVLYDSDQSSNRTGIETNINDYYSIYTP